MTLSLARLESLLQSLPNRYPSLLIDRIDAVEPGTEARGMKFQAIRNLAARSGAA